ncbi:MAG: Rid family hydrolase [Candidatus Nanopelagicales bacterium]
MPVERIGSGGAYEALYGYSRVVVTGGHDGWTGRTAGCAAVVNEVLAHPGDAFGQTMVARQIGLFALERAGFAKADTISTRMYAVDIAANSDLAGAAHRELLGEVMPAATMVGIAGLLDPRMLVEVELTAWRPDDDIVA